MYLVQMLMYGKEASSRKQEIGCQQYTIPNQRPKDKHCGNVHNRKYSMFSYEEIQKYNETDIRIYKYIVSDIRRIQYMTIRELAKELQVSTSTILRFCNKNNFDSYSEFKEALKEEITLQAACPPMEDLQELSDFFTRANSSAFEEKLIETVSQFKKKNCCVLSITNSPLSTLAKLSDWNFAYNLNTKRINGGYNGTTQIPVFFYYEAWR